MLKDRNPTGNGASWSGFLAKTQSRKEDAGGSNWFQVSGAKRPDLRSIDEARAGFQVPGSRFQIPGFRFKVSGAKRPDLRSIGEARAGFQVSGFKFQVSSFRFQFSLNLNLNLNLNGYAVCLLCFQTSNLPNFQTANADFGEVTGLLPIIVKSNPDFGKVEE